MCTLYTVHNNPHLTIFMALAGTDVAVKQTPVQLPAEFLKVTVSQWCDRTKNSDFAQNFEICIHNLKFMNLNLFYIVFLHVSHIHIKGFLDIFCNFSCAKFEN